MSRWRVGDPQLNEREHDWDAVFVMTNADTGDTVTITLQQQQKKPATDLVGALRALAQIFVRATGSDANLPGCAVEKLN